jgi:apolipoprotein N-acyltransferase
LLWVCLEFLKSHLLTGFPWENLAYSQYEYLTIIQFSDITGIYGVSFLIVLINTILVDVLMEWKNRKRIFLEMIFGCIILFLLAGYGTFSLNLVHSELNRAEAMEVSLIQGNIDQSIKWNPSYQQESVDIYRTLSLKNAPVGEGLIVWPETAMPFFFPANNHFTPQVRSVPKLTSDWLLFGSPSYQRTDKQIWYMNSAFLLSPGGDIAGKYDKVHLVPYGEYVPLRKFFPFLDKLVEGVGDFKKGEHITPLPLGKHTAGILICYEGIFPRIGREYKKRGANLLVNITNDAWFGTTSAPYQHMSMTVFRAVENRTFLLRSANTGISAIVSPTGQIVKKTDLFKRTVLKGSVKFLDRKTIYTLYGDIFAYACMFLLGLIILIAKRGVRSHV